MSLRVKLTFRYKGTAYHGWQTQPGKPTVQTVLQIRLAQILQARVSVLASGRTDAGVHTAAQVAHFDLPHPYDLKRLHHALNSVLPKDIVVLNLESVPSRFNSQRDAKRKAYEYWILNEKLRVPFLEDWTWHVPYELDVKLMKKAVSYLVGEHDFKSFCAADAVTKTSVRKIYSVKIEIIKAPKTFQAWFGEKPKLICIRLEGNGFLKNMVRNIAGSLVEVGTGKRSVKQFKEGFKSCDRTRMGRLAPPEGLVLKQVKY